MTLIIALFRSLYWKSANLYWSHTSHTLYSVILSFLLWLTAVSTEPSGSFLDLFCVFCCFYQALLQMYKRKNSGGDWSVGSLSCVCVCVPLYCVGVDTVGIWAKDLESSPQISWPEADVGVEIASVNDSVCVRACVYDFKHQFYFFYTCTRSDSGITHIRLTYHDIHFSIQCQTTTVLR